MPDRRLPLAGLVVLAGLLSAGCHATESAARPPGVPSTQVIGGQILHYRGTEAFLRPVLDELDPAVIHLSAGTTGDADNCERTPVAFLQGDTGTTITAVVAMYGASTKQPSAGLTCNMSAAVVQLDLRLRAPFGHRTLLDAGDGSATRAVLDPSTVAKPSTLPAGFRQTGIGWGAHLPSASRYYTGPNADTLILLQTDDIGLAKIHGPTVVRRFAVAGRPALMTTRPGFEHDFLVQWQPAPDTFIELSQATTPGHPGLTAAQLQALAQSVR